jgi:hypothetical protein
LESPLTFSSLPTLPFDDPAASSEAACPRSSWSTREFSFFGKERREKREEKEREREREREEKQKTTTKPFDN